jgi:FecR protein
MAMRFAKLALCLPALLLAGTPVLAAPGDAIGSAVTVVNLVTAKLEQDQRELAKGDDVRQQELIEVASDGRSELVLRDKTKLALGPGSRLLLDKFIYDPDISGGAIVMDLVRGSFRFITGIAAKPAYVIRTPTAAITVRGTIFDVYVQASGMTWLLLIEGAIEVCSEDGKCKVHDEPGKLIRVTSDKVENPVKWASLSGKDEVPFNQAFPFVVDSPSVDPDPIFTRDDIVLGTFPGRPGKGDDAKPSDDDDGKKADEGKRKTKAKSHGKRTRETKRKRRKDSDSASNGINGLNIGIGIGIGGFGGGKHHHGGMGGNPGGGKYGR